MQHREIGMNRTSPRPVALVGAAAAVATMFPALALAQVPGQWSPGAAQSQSASGSAASPATQAPASPSSAVTWPSGSDERPAAPSPSQSSTASQPPAAPSPSQSSTASHPPAGPTTPDASAGEVAPYYPQLPQERPAQAGRGFVLSASLGVQPVASPVLIGQTYSLVNSSGFAGQVAIGFKAGRAMLTLGLGISSLLDKRTLESDTSTSFLVIPGLQVALVRSRDQRAELIAQLRFGAGATVASGSSVPSSTKPDVQLFYELAPGARYWMHTQFALQFTAGYAGQWLFATSGTSSQTVGAHGLSAALGAVGVF